MRIRGRHRRAPVPSAASSGLGDGDRACSRCDTRITRDPVPVGLTTGRESYPRWHGHHHCGVPPSRTYLRCTELAPLVPEQTQLGVFSPSTFPTSSLPPERDRRADGDVETSHRPPAAARPRGACGGGLQRSCGQVRAGPTRRASGVSMSAHPRSCLTTMYRRSLTLAGPKGSLQRGRSEQGQAEQIASSLPTQAPPGPTARDRQSHRGGAPRRCRGRARAASRSKDGARSRRLPTAALATNLPSNGQQFDACAHSPAPWRARSRFLSR
jgi:hypothetical protein